MADLVYAYHTSGDARLVPAAWIDHPTLGVGWSLTPPAPESEPQTPTDPVTVLVTEPAEIPHKTPRGGDKED